MIIGITLFIPLLVLLILLSGFFSSSETALFSLSSMKTKVFKQDSDKRKQLVAVLLASPRDLLITIIILNVVVNILVQNVVSNIFGDQSHWWLNVGVPLALTLIFGEVIPKSIGLANNAQLSYRVAPAMNTAKKILFPIRVVLGYITQWVSRILFFFLRREKEISIDELQHALRASRDYGVLNHEEAELIRGYLKLEEQSVKEHMRPREEVLFFDQEEPLDRLIHLFVDQECSRIPICKESLDNITGIMTSRLFFIHREAIKEVSDLQPILKKPFFVPESMGAKALLKQLYDKEESLAIVVDEYGSVSGIIALEDLVETVVGEIVDRRDEKSRYTKSSSDVVIASGKLELAEFEQIFDIPLYSENHMVTLGGWLTEQLGDIPKAGTKYVTPDFLFHVLASDATRVRRIYVRRLKSQLPKEKS